jgi:choline dehydrogenase-like flavoprotein
MKNYDAVIIGSGQGGTPLSYNLADLGWNVALIERAQLGGSCINYGCTPTKTMIASSRIAHYAKIGPKFGIHPGKIQVNMAEVVARKDKIVESFRDGPQQEIKGPPGWGACPMGGGGQKSWRMRLGQPIAPPTKVLGKRSRQFSSQMHATQLWVLVGTYEVGRGDSRKAAPSKIN